MTDKKTSCADAARRLFGYLDGQLTPEQAAEIEAHLERCGGCAETHQAERKLLDAIRCCDGRGEDAALRERILAALRAAR